MNPPKPEPPQIPEAEPISFSECANGAAYISLGQSPQESVTPHDFEG